MKLKIALPTLLFFSLFLTNCKKEGRFTQSSTDPMIEKAKSYFTDSVLSITSTPVNPRAAAPRTVRWDQATVVSLSFGNAVLVPIKYQKELFIRTTQGGQNNFQLSNLTKLLVYQVKGGYHAEVITGLPDTNYLRYPSGSFLGMVYTEDWSGNLLAHFLYTNKGVLKYAPSGPSSIRSLSATPLELCYQITGYNYSTAEPSGGYAWMEAPECIPSMVPVDDPTEGYPGAGDYGSVAGSGGSRGGNSGSLTSSINLNPPNSIIQNVDNYFRCFTNVGGTDHTYTVTVCVDQPTPGARTPWTTTSGRVVSSVQSGNPIDVGHTFLMLTETYGSTTITRNIGFYPSAFVYQLSPSARGVMNDDEYHQYNISASFNTTNAEFFSILNYISQQSKQGMEYNLNYNNCTSFALHAVAQGGINLPSTIGTWLDGMGNNPGDLGEDIRSQDIPGMTLNTGIITDFQHNNVGQCN